MSISAMRRFGVALGLWLAMSSRLASAQTVALDGPTGYSFDIDVGSGVVGEGTADATDSWPFLCVCGDCAAPDECPAGSIYGGGGYTTDLAGRRVVLETVVLEGLEVHREVFVPATGSIDFARYMDVLENTTGADVTVNVRFGSVTSAWNDLGSDAETHVTATSDGDLTVETTDTFFCTDDVDGDHDPSLGHVMQGIDRSVLLSAAGIGLFGRADHVGWEFDEVTIPAGRRVAFVAFFIQAADAATAAAHAAALDDVATWPAEALAGLPEPELGAVLNFVGDADGDGFTMLEGDCDNWNAAAHPDAAEVCDGLDNDCNDVTDEGLLPRDTYYADLDGDGFGDEAAPRLACTTPPSHTSTVGDCDDGNALVYPGASELCDELDNDCDGATDEELTYFDVFEDLDGDGFGDEAESMNTCELLPGWATAGGDCDDECAACHPGGVEVCDYADNDCNGETDEGEGWLVQTWADHDADGFGNPSTGLERCVGEEGFVTNGDDCDDSDARSHPGAAEPCDGFDNDCDGLVDEDVAQVYYVDTDRDGYGTTRVEFQSCDAAPPPGYSANSDDCDDRHGLVNPGADELPGDGIDNDCDGEIDEAASHPADGDADADADGDADADAEPEPAGRCDCRAASASGPGPRLRALLLF